MRQYLCTFWEVNNATICLYFVGGHQSSDSSSHLCHQRQPGKQLNAQVLVGLGQGWGMYTQTVLVQRSWHNEEKKHVPSVGLVA